MVEKKHLRSGEITAIKCFRTTVYDNIDCCCDVDGNI